MPQSHVSDITISPRIVNYWNLLPWDIVKAVSVRPKSFKIVLISTGIGKNIMLF